MTAKKRRPDKAKQGWQRTGEIQSLFLYCYARDDEFGKSLEALFAQMPTTLLEFLARYPRFFEVETRAHYVEMDSDCSAYLAAIADLAESVGLERFRVTGSGGMTIGNRAYGEVLIHKWICQKAVAQSQGRELSPRAFNGAFGYGGIEPNIAETDSPPDVSFTIDEKWSPQTEPPAVVKTRLLELALDQIVTQVDHIADEASARGYSFNASKKACRDVTWLFWKLRFGMGYTKIQQRWNGATSSPELIANDPLVGINDLTQVCATTVAKAIVKRADALSIDRTGWSN
jgi:hypothetical protein